MFKEAKGVRQGVGAGFGRGVGCLTGRAVAEWDWWDSDEGGADLGGVEVLPGCRGCRRDERLEAAIGTAGQTR
jgi:hypothetical protein